MKKVEELFRYLVSNLGEKIYLVGGSSRDLLLGREFLDYDFASPYLIDDVKKVFKDADYTFKKYGIAYVKYQEVKLTLATFRKENSYVDSRHPSYIEFVDSLYLDSFRRDFTINAIYIDKDMNVIDPQNGREDLESRIIRMIGDIPTRIKEDPLRMLRALRFSYTLNFKIEDELDGYIHQNLYLLQHINKDKITMELNKCPSYIREKIKEEIEYGTKL